jgi:hypothetical protein
MEKYLPAGIEDIRKIIHLFFYSEIEFTSHENSQYNELIVDIVVSGSNKATKITENVFISLVKYCKMMLIK